MQIGEVPEAFVGLQFPPDAVPPVEGEVVRAGATVEVHYPHSRSAKLSEIKIIFHKKRPKTATGFNS